MSDKSHVVQRLAVHLPEQHHVYYEEGREEEAIARASVKQTTLTAWFQLNCTDEESRNYIYSDIPLYYVFDKNETK